jgi:hypothetical protein
MIACPSNSARWMLIAMAVLAMSTSRLCGALPAALSPTDAEFFENRIRPLLIDQCYKCHSAKAEKLKGELLLDSRDGVLKGGENGPVLTPGDPDKSRLIEAIRWTNKDLKMPPKHQLTGAQVADLVAWVKMGAPDPRTEVTKPAAGPAIDYAAARKTWAFRVPVEPTIPAVNDAAWCKSPVDNFILEKLEAKSLKPAPRADKRTLIRRAYFDLIGLPPKPGEVDAFLQDNSPDAFAKVVDHLLASPHYGERWARHWLDVVRYTDSFDQRGIGSEGDCVYAWRYRDWVVKSLNQDLPYDQFVMNQIAGDLLPAKKPGEFNSDGVIATCMYVIGNWPGGDADRKKMMTDMADDQVDVTARTFLGITLACARCHDHKFDPIAQKDYYAMAGIFLSTHFLPNPGSPASGVGMLKIPLATPVEVERQKQYEAHTAELQKQLDQFIDAQYAAKARQALSRADEYLMAAAEYARRGDSDRQSASIDHLATGKKLDGYLLARWIEYLAPMWKSESPRRLLSRANHNIAGITGVDGWGCADGRPCPNVVVNNTAGPVSITTLTLPAKSIAVHPGPSTGVAVGWTSPISGTISISGKLIDADPNCGDGIDWRIERSRDRGAQTLASGSFPNGGTQALADGEGGAQLKSIEVKAGDLVQLTIYPKGDYTCDTTVVELEIAEHSGAKRVWNLVHDVLPDLLVAERGNPHSDAYSNAGVWEFFEAGEERQSNSAAPGSALQAWIAAASGQNDPGQVAKLAVAVRDALLAYDAKPTIPAKPNNAEGKFYQDLTTPTGPFWGAARKDLNQLPPELKAAITKMADGLAGLKKNAPPPIEQAQGLIEGGIPQSEYEGVHDSHIMIRGRYDRPGPNVPRGFPTLLAGDHQPTITQGSGRRELARWVASPENPMTAKVMANRIWQHHFGQGIVRTPNNYGKLGIPPTHPELLDYLARRFIENGWSIKSMHRMIMLSAAYQQSSEPDASTLRADPDNLLFGCMNRRRLEAEPLRDSLLAVTGTLDETMGGPAFRDLATPRRTLYLMTIRSDRANYRMLFDAADPTAIVDSRTDSTVAPQALFLMNDPFVLDRGRVLAERVIKEQPADERARIQWLYQLLYSRPATDREMEIGLGALEKIKKTKKSDGTLAATQSVWEQYCQVLLCANEFVYVD